MPALRGCVLQVLLTDWVFCLCICCVFCARCVMLCVEGVCCWPIGSFVRLQHLVCHPSLPPSPIPLLYPEQETGNILEDSSQFVHPTSLATNKSLSDDFTTRQKSIFWGTFEREVWVFQQRRSNFFFEHWWNRASSLWQSLNECFEKNTSSIHQNVSPFCRKALSSEMNQKRSKNKTSLTFKKEVFQSSFGNVLKGFDWNWHWPNKFHEHQICWQNSKSVQYSPSYQTETK